MTATTRLLRLLAFPMRTHDLQHPKRHGLTTCDRPSCVQACDAAALRDRELRERVFWATLRRVQLADNPRAASEWLREVMAEVGG